jgi:hypothetical protein
VNGAAQWRDAPSAFIIHFWSNCFETGYRIWNLARRKSAFKKPAEVVQGHLAAGTVKCQEQREM